jgi:N-terminal acetyltransferase B complex non-catalytic subunit
LRETYGEKSDTVKEISMQINLARFERFIGNFSHLNSTETNALVNRFWKLYEEALPVGMRIAFFRLLVKVGKFPRRALLTFSLLHPTLGKDLEETERQYGDDYVIMAAHLLIDLHKDTSKKIRRSAAVTTMIIFRRLCAFY